MKKEIEKFCKLIKRLSEMNSLNIEIYNKIINDYDLDSFKIEEGVELKLKKLKMNDE